MSSKRSCEKSLLFASSTFPLSLSLIDFFFALIMFRLIEMYIPPFVVREIRCRVV